MKRCAYKVTSPSARMGKAHVSEDVSFLMKLMEKFRKFAQDGDAAVEARHKDEEMRVQSYIAQANSSEAKLAMQTELSASAYSLIEEKKVFKSIMMFDKVLEKTMGDSYEATKGCADITCGPHATCTTTTLGGECVCDEGFIGNGQDCHAPEPFLPKLLLHDGGHGTSAKM